MDIAATTDDRSSFFMPLSSKSNISSADFVTFREPARVDTVDNLARKKMMFERKRQQKSDAGSRMDISLALNVRPGVEVELTVSGNTLCYWTAVHGVSPEAATTGGLYTASSTYDTGFSPYPPTRKVLFTAKLTF